MKPGLMAVLMLLALMARSAPACAADVLIRITGNIKVNTCELSAASQEVTVPMKSAILGKNRFRVGDTFEPTPFSINISKCNQATTKARVTFSGTTSLLDTTALALGDSGAGGLGIQLRDAQDAVVSFNHPSAAYALQPDVTNTLTFTARYVATAAVVLPGSANATADFAIEYE